MNTLSHQRLDSVCDIRLIAVTGKALRHSPRQVYGAVTLAQQQRARLRRYRSALEPSHHRALLEFLKNELISLTVCLHRPPHKKRSTR